jgi:hypothetical protein
MKCFVCKTKKRKSAFYGNGRRICRPCNRARVKRWVANNPGKAYLNQKRYRSTTKGRATSSRIKRRYNLANTATTRAWRQAYIGRLPDAYIRKLLRAMGVISPTAAEIAGHRNRLHVLRAQLTFKLISHVITH